MAIDILVIGLAFFAAFAWGSNEPWAMGFIAMTASTLLALRLIWEAWHGRLLIRRKWFYMPLVFFLIYAGIQASAGSLHLDIAGLPLPASVETHSTKMYLLLTLSYVSIMFLVENGFRSRRAVKALILGIIVLGALEAAYGLIQYLGDYNYIWHHEKTAYQGLATGTLINRNHYALLLNLCICTGIGYLYYRSMRLLMLDGIPLRHVLSIPGAAKLAWIILWLALMGVAVVFSMSRMGIIAMFCSLGAMMIAGNALQSGKRMTAIGLLLLVAILGFSVYIGLDSVLARYENIAKQRDSEQDRVALWRDAWRMIEKQPIFGQGLGTFQWTFPAYETVLPDIPAKYAHNDYIQALAEVGVLGLGLILWAFVATWRLAARNLILAGDPLVKGIGLTTIGALTAVALQEITDFSLYIPGVAVTAAVLAGLNLRASSMMRRKAHGPD